MRIVWSWLQEFCPTERTASELAEALTLHGVKVEEILRPWEGVAGVVVARVVKVEDHPNSEKLTVVTVDDGEGEHIVCAGVRNYAVGDLLPWARPGSRVPVLPEPLAPREMGGVVSNGMLCSPSELAIADTHEGILVLNGEPLSPGDDVAAAFGLDDEVLDIEVEPNRPDFLSVLGVAREVSALTGTPLSDPFAPLVESDERAADVASIRIDAIDGCPRYVARVIRGIGEGVTPVRAQARLTASGMRPISPVVDATNYAMLELGQPLHAFDLQRLRGPGIVVRRAAEGEPLTTLDGIDRVMDAGDLLICDVERPVAIAGVMGGATSEVGGDTVDVLLESAYFTRTGILRTARSLDLHTEASYRFERGTDPEGVDAGVTRGAQLMAAWAHGTILRGVAEDGATPPRRWVSVRPARASELLGYDVSREDAETSFDRLGLVHRGETGADERLEVEVPGYRVDIEREVDLIEEVARLLGYDRIGVRVPPTGQAGGVPGAYRFRARAVDGLVRGGLREVRTMTFASAEDLAMAPGVEAVPVTNPLQSDEAFMRTRLLPGLVHVVARNQARGVADVAVFEAGTVFSLDGDSVMERQHVAFALAGPADERWYADPRPFDALDATGVLGSLLTELGVGSWHPGPPPDGPFHPGRSAAVLVGDEQVGTVGELHPRVSRAADVAGRLAVAEVVLDRLVPLAADSLVVSDVPRFPPVRRDLAFVVADAVSAGDVQEAICEAAGELLGRCLLFDVFSGAPLAPGTKSLAFAVDLRAEDRTLTREETEPVVAAIVERLSTSFDAELRAG
ncbi:MAG: phenylalanine--tRNA ligase subunit beta [Actinomycetota bacterium]|nr:phenylalanine--tRNA ligase subunit beta [Actinomycetota bacterium]